MKLCTSIVFSCPLIFMEVHLLKRTLTVSIKKASSIIIWLTVKTSELGSEQALHFQCPGSSGIVSINFLSIAGSGIPKFREKLEEISLPASLTADRQAASGFQPDFINWVVNEFPVCRTGRHSSVKPMYFQCIVV